MKRLTLVLALTCVVPGAGSGQGFEDRDALLSDLRHLVRQLEAIHPDPYSSFGGKVEFKRTVQRLWDEIPATGMTAPDFYRLVRPIFQELADGHSFIRNPEGEVGVTKRRYLPLRFKIAEDAIFVSETQAPHGDLIGWRLVAVEGRALDEALTAATSEFPAENEFGAARTLLRLLATDQGAARLFPQVHDVLTLELAGVSGERIARQISFVDEAEKGATEWIGRRWSRVPNDSSPFFYVSWKEEDTAYLRVTTIMAREAFEIMRRAGRTDLGEALDRFYARRMRRPRPEELDEAIAQLPSLTETVYRVLLEMKSERLQHLIVDLRGNDGGWSAILKPIYYMLHGDAYFAADMPIVWATQISNAFLTLNGTTLEAYDEGLGLAYTIGDYRIREESAATSAREARQRFLQDLRGLSSFRHVAELDGQPLHTPRVTVVTDAATFSAAYHFMFHLWRLGARVVGVSPSQAGNAFVDGIPFTLPNTGLSGAIASTAQILFPEDPERGRVFRPDVSMKWADYRRYDFDVHAEVRQALSAPRR